MHNFHLLRNADFHLEKLAPIENGSLVTFINNYLYAMVSLLNDFSNSAESRLIVLSHKLDRCFANLVILEMKLNSLNSTSTCLAAETSCNENIGQCDNNHVQNEQQISIENILSKDNNVYNDNQCYNEEISVCTEASDQNETTMTNAIEPDDVNERARSSSSNEPSSHVVDNVDEENIAVYKRMLKFGVHEYAVRQKMIMDGVDPSLLNI